MSRRKLSESPLATIIYEDYVETMCVDDMPDNTYFVSEKQLYIVRPRACRKPHDEYNAINAVTGYMIYRETGVPVLVEIHVKGRIA